MGELFDLAIIGGGINGTALAQLAADNGYSVALLEKADFGAGVTSRSTRLIHGGLRYLEHGQIKVVRESLRERDALLDEFPYQVRPLPFLVPVYCSDSRKPWWIGLGLEAYSWIARSRLLPRHQHLSPRQAFELEPGLKRVNLNAAFLYFDCQAVYPERLALEMALMAEESGAEVQNHAEVTALLIESKPKLRVAGVAVNGREYRARLVINAAGPWVDHVLQLMPRGAGRPLLSLIGGTHIVTGIFPGAPSHAIYHEALADRRPFFIIPWRGLWLIGTTETPVSGDPAGVAPSRTEIVYLLRETNFLIPEAKLTLDCVLYAYAGPRPLLRSDSRPAQSITRDHAIYDHEAKDGVAGMLTLAGGKLTTARAFAAEALARIAQKLGRPRPVRRSPAKQNWQGIPSRLAEIYGRRAADIVALAEKNPELDRPACPPKPTTAAEIVHAVTKEKARTLGDILLRRTGLGFEPDLQEHDVAHVAEIAAPLLGWDKAGIAAALAAYRDEADRTLHRRPER